MQLQKVVLPPNRGRRAPADTAQSRKKAVASCRVWRYSKTGGFPQILQDMVIGMRVPMDLILERLEYVSPENHLKESHLHRWIKGMKLLPPDCVDLPEEYLYVTDRCYEIPDSCEASIVIIDPEGAWTHFPPSYLLLRTSVPLPEIFDQLLGLQTLLQNWDLQLSLSVSEKRGVQHLLELSEPVLGNPIVVLDPAYRVLASTPGLDTDDWMFGELFELGYLTQTSFNKLQQHGYFTPEHYTGETLIIPPSEIKRNYSTLTAVLDATKTHVRYEVLMEFSNAPYSEGLFQLYLYLLDRILYYLQNDRPGSEGRARYEYLVLDLLEGRCTSGEEIRERRSCFLAHHDGKFNAVVIRLEHNTEMFRRFAYSTLQDLFTESLFILYRDSILFFANLGNIEQHLEDQASSILTRLSDYLEHANAYAGISIQFERLEQLRLAYVQAEHALETGRKLGGQLNPNEDARTFWYSYYHVYRILEAAGDQMEKEELTSGIYLDLLAYDTAHHTRYLEILLCFLHHERNYSDTGAELHMHRNTIIYHIQRIVDLFHINLDDSELRLQLLLSERIHRMYPEWFS